MGIRSSSLQFTRREILAAFLGLPFAAAACRNSSAPALPAGEIIGASDQIGHRLRDGLRVTPTQDRWQQSQVVIVGGGVAGLTAAWRFLQAGFTDFILLELERAPGGTARSGQSTLNFSNQPTSIGYPWGAHYIPAPMKENRALIKLFDEIGLLDGRDQNGQPIVAEQYLCRDPEERIFYRGRWFEGLYLYAGATADDLAQFKAFRAEIARWVGWRDGRNRRAFTIPTAFASDDAEVTSLDKLTMADWLKKQGWNSARLRWLIDYGCRDDYGSTIEDTSAWAGLFYFVSRVEKPGDEAQSLVTFPEGNGRLVAHLYQRVKEHVKLGYAVAELVPDPASSRVDIIAVDHEGREAIGIHADQAIFAAPHFLSNYLIRPYRDNPPAHVAEFHYGAWMVANLTLKDRPKSQGFPLCWDNVIYESPALGYVVATHQRGLDFGPTVFTYYYPLCDTDPHVARKRLLSTDWQGWADVALTDLSRAHGEIGRLCERIDIMRWGHAMIKPRPGFIWGGARAAAQQPFQNIYFAHSDLSGVALFEEAFYHGIRTAEEILTTRKISFETVI